MKSLSLLLVAVAVQTCAGAVFPPPGEPSEQGQGVNSHLPPHEKREDSNVNPSPDEGDQVQSGTTTTTWDCCKPACGWPANAQSAGAKGSVKGCSQNGRALTDPNAQGACQGKGDAYACLDFQPKVVNSTFAYGFAGHGDGPGGVCCKCYQFTWTSGPAKGKSMVVQAINTSGLPSPADFDIYTPGGGVGAYPDTCSKQYNAPHKGWGRQYGGVSSEAECDKLPLELRAGCKWRWTFADGDINMASVTYHQVECPATLTDISGCSNSN